MSWSWSHTTEAYACAQKQVQEMPREKLEVIYAEWNARIPDDGEGLNQEAYAKALAFAKTHPEDLLADFIWEKMEEQAICTNGGWEAWVCPYGCGCHMVPFSPPKQEAA